MKYKEPKSEQMKKRLEESIIERTLWISAQNATSCLLLMLLFTIMMGVLLHFLVGS